MRVHEFKSILPISKRARVYLAWLALALAAALLVPMSAGAHDSHAAKPARRESPRQSSAKSSAKYEIKFLKEMIAHHQMAVMMSEECMKRATHQELKDMCHKMAADQAEEIRQMRTWLHDWYQVHVDSTMTHGEMTGMNGMASMKRLSALNGREYEIAFMKEMTRHHEMAIKRAKGCQTKASHQELIAMCEMIETNQKREIAQFKDWLCKWYQQCR